MKIMMDINARSALLAGKILCGQVVVPVPETLTGSQREELALWRTPPGRDGGPSADFYLMTGIGPAGAILARLADTDPTTIGSVLDQLAAARVAEAKAAKAREAEEATELDRVLAKVARRPTADLLRECWGGGLHYELRAPGVDDIIFAKRYPNQWAAAKALRDERNATVEANRAHSKVANEAAEAEKEKRDAAEIVERDRWIAEHGSQRLKMIVEEDMIDDSLAVYRDERLAAERPCWIWDATWHNNEVGLRDVRNPAAKDLLWYRATRKRHPECKLIYAFLAAAQPDDYYEDDDDDTPRVSEAVIKDQFLGRTVILRHSS